MSLSPLLLPSQSLDTAISSCACSAALDQSGSVVAETKCMPVELSQRCCHCRLASQYLSSDPWQCCVLSLVEGAVLLSTGDAGSAT